MKKAFLLTLAALTALCMLFSCSPDGGYGGSSGGQGGGSKPPAGDFIYAPGSTVTIIYNGDPADVDSVVSAIWTAAGVRVDVKTDAAQPSAHEIAVGATNRALTERAKRQFEREKQNDDQVGYALFSDGNSIAVYFEEDEFGFDIARDRAIDYLTEEVIASNYSLSIDDGRISSLVFDPLVLKKEEERAEIEAKWVRFEQELSVRTEHYKELTEAFRFYVDNVCTDDAVDWLADLFDLERGGFYFSNSARNTEGYLPDIESTSQAVGFFVSTGMIASKDFPEWFADKIVYFTKGLQDPNGYIYHPQWDRATLEANTSRMGRDISSAKGLLERFGASPTYDMPNGMKGDGILADGTPVVKPTSAITLRLGGAKALAVSYVVPTGAIDGFTQLESEESFRAYLDEQAARNKLPQNNNRYRSFYQIANELCTNAAQILDRDKELLASGAGYSLAEIAITWLNEHQNKETGLWDPGVTYDNTNAYYKAINFYNSMGYAIPNAELAIESIVEILMGNEPVETILYMFNVWGSLNHTIENINKYGDRDIVARTRAKMMELGGVAITATAKNQLLFRKSDGSYSYFPDTNTAWSQSMPVAVINTNEGDVNCTTLTIGGILSAMAKTLGVTDIIPPVWTKADGQYCLKRIRELSPVIKNDLTIEVDYVDFDDSAVGSAPLKDDIEASMIGGSFLVVDAPTKDNPSNKAVEFNTLLTHYETVKVPTTAVSPASTCYVFEADFCIPKSTRDAEIQVLMQDSVYMTTINVVGDEVRVWESSSRKPDYAVRTELDAVCKVGEWFNLKMEFYPGDDDTVRAKIYYNGKCVSATDNYFDDTGAKLTGDGKPRSSYQYVNIIAVTTCETTLLIDNVAAYATGQSYKAEKNLDINVDAPARERVTYDLADGALPESFAANELAAIDNGTLKLVSGASLTAPLRRVATGSGVKTAVFESDVYVSPDASGTLLRLLFREDNTLSEDLLSLDLAVVSTSDGKCVKLLPSPDGKVAEALDLTMPIGESFNLRLEYFEEELATLVFVNDTLLGMVGVACSGAPKYVAAKAELTVPSGAVGYITLDNIILEKDRLDFTERATPKENSTIHDFSAADGSLTLGGGAVIEGGAVKLGASLDEMKLVADNVGVVLTATSYSSKIKLGASYDGAYRFMLNSEDGKPIIGFDVVLKEGIATVREYYAGGVGTSLSRSKVSGEFTIAFKYFYAERLMLIYVNDQPVALNSLGYVYDNEELAVSYVTVTKVDGGGCIYLDDVIIENTISFYVPTALKDTVMSSDNNNTMENAYSGFGPVNSVYVKRSSGSQLDVKGIFLGTDENGNPYYSKFLALKTTPGANDTLDFKMADENKKPDGSVAVFEADMYLECDPSKTSGSAEVYLYAGSTKISYISLAVSRGGNVTLGDWYQGMGTIQNGNISKEKTVFKLRMEYYEKDGGIVINFFVDGEYKCTSTRTYFVETAPSASAIDLVRFYTTNATSATFMFDNVKFYHTDTATDTGVEDEPDEPETPPTDPEPPVDPDPEDPKPPVEPDTPEGPETGEVKPSQKPDVGFDDVTGEEPTKPDTGSEEDDGGWTNP